MRNEGGGGGGGGRRGAWSYTKYMCNVNITSVMSTQDMQPHTQKNW